MYNRYQGNQPFTVIDPEPEPRQDRAGPAPDRQPPRDSPTAPSPLLGEFTGGLSKLLAGLGKHFSLDSLDTGDILLVLIILFLYLEGDNLELVITLGLMILLGLGDD